jgi:hypothetical protein
MDSDAFDTLDTLDTEVKLAIYRHFVATTRAPAVAQVAERVRAAPGAVREAFGRLYAQRLLVLEPDGATIRMAPPFSAVPTQHRVRVGEKDYVANCAWDALGIPAALHRAGEVLSRCDQTLEPIRITVRDDGPQPEPCVVHFPVPAALWWKDIVFT